jgi:hypothetical protein
VLILIHARLSITHSLATMTDEQGPPYPLQNTQNGCWFLSLFYCLESITEYREELKAFLPPSMEDWRACFARYAQLQSQKKRSRSPLIINSLVKTIGLDVRVQEDVNDGFLRIFQNLPDSSPTHCAEHAIAGMAFIQNLLPSHTFLCKTVVSGKPCGKPASMGLCMSTRLYGIVHRFLVQKQLVQDYTGDVSQLTKISRYQQKRNTLPDIPYITAEHSEWFLTLSMDEEIRQREKGHVFTLKELLNSFMYQTREDPDYTYKAFNPDLHKVVEYKVMAEKTMLMVDRYHQQLPPLIPLYIKRFEYEKTTGRFSKISNPVELPMRYNFMHMFSPGQSLKQCFQSEEFEYEMMAFIEHLGASIKSGHFVATVCRKGSWFRCDDDCITSLSLEQAERGSSVAYMCFYRRVVGDGK